LPKNGQSSASTSNFNRSLTQFVVISPERGSVGEAPNRRKQGDLGRSLQRLAILGWFTSKIIHF